MTTRVAPSQGTVDAAVAVLRHPRSAIAAVALPLWFGFWAWHDWQDSRLAGLVLGVLGIVLGGLTFHRLVRQRRGLPGVHWSSPAFAAVAMLVLYAAANAVEPVISARAIAVNVVGAFVILAAVTVGEILFARRRSDAASASL